MPNLKKRIHGGLEKTFARREDIGKIATDFYSRIYSITETENIEK